MGWRNLPSWLKGGIISSILFLILLALAFALPDTLRLVAIFLFILFYSSEYPTACCGDESLENY